jgi:hypothetical protein
MPTSMDRCVRVADGLAVQVGHRDLEERGQLLGVLREAPDSAVGVMQDHQVRAGRRLPLAQPGQQRPRARRGRRDPPADVADHDRLAELQAQDASRVDPGVDAAGHPQGLVRREGQAAGRPAGGKGRVPPDQLIGRDTHDHPA